MLKQNQKLSGIPAVICILFLNSPRSNRYCSPCSNNQTDPAQWILKNKSKGNLIYKISLLNLLHPLLNVWLVQQNPSLQREKDNTFQLVVLATLLHN